MLYSYWSDSQQLTSDSVKSGWYRRNNPFLLLLHDKVIEDRVLESYGQNFSSKSSGISDPNAPDVGQLELAAVLGEEQLNKVSQPIQYCIVMTAKSVFFFFYFVK